MMKIFADFHWNPSTG